MNQQDYSPNMDNKVLPTSTPAIISLVAGILGFTAFPIMGSIAAIWAGYEARKETRSIPPTASGDGMATAGIVLGWIQIGLAAVAGFCVFSYFSFVISLGINMLDWILHM